jgi:P27 family predicted phage terminase small subunit
MAGQRQKHPDDLVFRRGGRVKALSVVPLPGTPRVPACPRGLHLQARRAWRVLWTSRLAGAFKDTDLPALGRWAWYFSEWAKVVAEIVVEGAVIQGAKGPMFNPRIRYLKLCEAAMRELEKAFGMDALARLRLGLTLVEQESAVAKLKRATVPVEMVS